MKKDKLDELKSYIEELKIAKCELIKNSDNFSQMRGKELAFNGITLITTFSPTFLLRNPSFKKDAYYDMLKIKSYMESLV